VHAGSVVGEVQDALEPLLDVIGVQYGQLADLFQFGPETHDIAVGSNHDPHIAVKGVQLADGLRKIFGKEIFFVFFEHARDGEKRFQAFCDTNGTGARSAAAMGRRESLVEVQVQNVHSDVPGAHNAHEGVHV